MRQFDLCCGHSGYRFPNFFNLAKQSSLQEHGAADDRDD